MKIYKEVGINNDLQAASNITGKHLVKIVAKLRAFHEYSQTCKKFKVNKLHNDVLWLIKFSD